MPSISSSSTLNPLTKEGRVSSSAGVENKKRLNWAAGSDRSIASSLYAFKPCHVALSPLRLFRAHCGQTQNSAGECELRMQNGHNATTQMETCQPWEPRLLSTLFLKRRYSVAFIAARLGAANEESFCYGSQNSHEAYRGKEQSCVSDCCGGWPKS